LLSKGRKIVRILTAVFLWENMESASPRADYEKLSNNGTNGGGGADSLDCLKFSALIFDSVHDLHG